jgi:hypothetical protein
MLVAVIILNLLLGCLCLAVALMVWKLRPKIAHISETILSLDGTLDRALHIAPPKIYTAQRGSQEARQYYAKLETQLAKLNQMITILGLSQIIWRRRGSVLRNKR